MYSNPSREKAKRRLINHLLVIDDDPLTEVLLEGISNNLHLVNRYVFEAGGKQALQYLLFCEKTHDFPELIILDLKMPEMDGFEFLAKYEELFYEKFPATKIVIATNAFKGYSDSREEEFNCISLYMNKPIKKEKFEEIYNSLFTFQ
jgi:CheY-like chemotaxis protein